MKTLTFLLATGLLFSSVKGQGSTAIEDPGAPPNASPQNSDGPPDDVVQHDEPPPLFASSVSTSQDYAYFDDDELEIVATECPELSDCATPSEKVESWLCDYTNYKKEAMKWKSKFEEWWSSCDESAYTQSVWESSFDCIDTSMVKCTNQDKHMCKDLGMDCPVCVCTDGKYQDSRELYRLWRKETYMFRERLEIYKASVESCTRSGNVGCADAPTPDPTDEPGSGSGDFGSGSGSGSGSGEGDEYLDIHM